MTAGLEAKTFLQRASNGREERYEVSINDILEGQMQENFTLRSGDKSFTANGTCTAGTPCIELRSPLAPPRVQPVQGRRDSELLVAAMGIGGRDPLMYEALRQGARLARGSAGRHRQPTG